MSMPSWSAGIASAATTVAGASAENSGAMTVSIGSTSSTPLASARSMYSRTTSIFEASSRDCPTS